MPPRRLPFVLATSVLLILAGGAGCSRQRPATVNSPAAPPADELARVGDESITIAQFQTAMARRGVSSDPAARRALLDEMIRFRATVQEAKRRGLEHDPEMVAAWEAMLAGKVRESDRERLRDRLEVTPAEVEAEYAAHPETNRIPARVRIAVIFVEAPATFTKEKRAERRALIAEARTKALALGPEIAGFGPLAAETSFDQATKYRGGDLGYLIAGTDAEGVERPVLDAAFALANPGEVSEIIETPRGFHLVRLTERQPEAVRPLTATVRANIANRLARERNRVVDQELSAAILADRRVETHTERLAAIPSPTGLPLTRTTDNPPPPPPEMPDK